MYDWLLDYQTLQNDIDYQEYKLERCETELKRWVEGDLVNVKLHRDSIASNLEERIEAHKEEIAHKKEQRDKLLRLVDTFKGLDHKILRLKYVDGMTLESIAAHLHYSESYIYKKHAEMKRMLKFADELKLSLY
ncbi:DUF1492 domain-containing protein [Salibacterium lacus]|uniref:DUF1492 domain-containing protein n=1 Tax=Salibacterium lacus TaxID=1898109 RepID=A0ABW5T2Q2_9BACI